MTNAVASSGSSSAGAEPALDRGAPLPLYFQLKEALLREIRDQRLQPGDQLPTEAEIELRFGVSRSTIRQALSELVRDGLVERIQGKGTFVGSPRPRHIPLLTSFSENMVAQGYRPSRRVLESRVVPADGEVAARLGVAEGQPCRFLRRLLLADGRPVGLSRTWLPASVVGRHDDLFGAERLERSSLYEVLQAPPISLVLDHGVETITAGAADPEQAEALGCAVGAPLLAVTRLTNGPDGRPVEWTFMVFAEDRYEYRVEMSRPARRRGSG